MKNKKILLMLFLLITLITIPVTCNAEEVPPLKWENFTTNKGSDTYCLKDKLYNIGKDILIVHNSSIRPGNYIRLYNSSGELKWEYIQEGKIENYFLINNEYFALVEYISGYFDPMKSISLIDLKTGKVSKTVDISKAFENISKYGLELIYTEYKNEKIILLFIDYHTQYHFYTLDLDGNIEISKTSTLDIKYNVKAITIENNIYVIDDINIFTFSSDTGKIINITPLNSDIDIKNIIEYKDGFIIFGSQNGYMSLKYYNLKNGTILTKQFEEEGTIYSIKTDNKDNMYIAGQLIDENTTGSAYFSKYTINNWNFKKVYESIYENDELKNDTYTFDDIVILKNNKFALSGNTLNGYRYYTSKNFVVYYDGTKSYKIDKVIKGNGNIDIVESEVEDNEVKYQVKPRFGYKLISLKIVTESGKEVEVSDDYSFIMPNENITITAIFEPIINNPITSNNIIKILLELIISISVVYLITKRIRKRKFNN